MRTDFASAVSLADWDRDGKLDLVVGSINGRVDFVPNVSRDGKLVFRRGRPVGDDPRQVSSDAGPLVVDWDGDGVPDLLVGESSGAVTFYRGQGKEGPPVLGAGVQLVPPLPDSSDIRCRRDEHGVWTLPPLGRPGHRTKLAAYDWNGDGKLDLLVGDACTAVTPEPELTAEQVELRVKLEDEIDRIRSWMMKRSTDTRSDARHEIERAGAPDKGSDAQEKTRARIDAKLSEILRRDAEYQEWLRRQEELSERLRPLQSQHSTHGFVWVYLRKAT